MCVCLFVCLCVYESVCVCVHLLMVFCQTNHAPLSSLQQSAEDPKWLISLKSAGYLIIGVSMVRSQTYCTYCALLRESSNFVIIMLCALCVCSVMCVYICTYVHVYTIALPRRNVLHILCVFFSHSQAQPLYLPQVTIFSDPMVSVLAAITNKDNARYQGNSMFSKGQYIPIGGQPFLEFCTPNIVFAFIHATTDYNTRNVHAHVLPRADHGSRMCIRILLPLRVHSLHS